MKHLVPDLKYCKQLKGIIKDCEYCYMDDKLSQIDKDRIMLEWENVIPAPTAGEMIKEYNFVIYSKIEKGLIYCVQTKQCETYKDKKLENALAKALIKLNKSN